MSKHKANVDSNDTRYTKKCTFNTILIFDDNVKTCYSKVNIVLAKTEGVRSVSWIWSPGSPCKGAAAPGN